MVQVSENDNGRKIEVAAGETLELTLPETSGTGFKWALVSNGHPMVVLEDENYLSTNTPGSGRMHHWRFRTLRLGTAKLELIYGRSWEKQPVRSFTLEIRIEPRP